MLSKFVLFLPIVAVADDVGEAVSQSVANARTYALADLALAYAYLLVRAFVRTLLSRKTA